MKEEESNDEEKGDIRLFVPLKATIVKTKKIGGPYIRIRNQYVFALALMVSGSSYRWEPHLVIDRLNYLEEKGVSAIAGPLALIDYNGRSKIIETARKHGISSIYVPPWKFPLLFAFEKAVLGEEELFLLDKAGLVDAEKFLKDIVKYVRIIEL